MEKSKTDEVMLKPNQRVVYYKKSQQTNIVGNKPDNMEKKVQEKNEETGKLTYLISKGISNSSNNWAAFSITFRSEVLPMIILTFGFIVFNFIFLVNRIVLLFCAFVLQEKQAGLFIPLRETKIAHAGFTWPFKKTIYFRMKLQQFKRIIKNQ